MDHPGRPESSDGRPRHRVGGSTLRWGGALVFLLTAFLPSYGCRARPSDFERRGVPVEPTTERAADMIPAVEIAHWTRHRIWRASSRGSGTSGSGIRTSLRRSGSRRSSRRSSRRADGALARPGGRGTRCSPSPSRWPSSRSSTSAPIIEDSRRRAGCTPSKQPVCVSLSSRSCTGGRAGRGSRSPRPSCRPRHALRSDTRLRSPSTTAAGG
jgi:hypothetical protein